MSTNISGIKISPASFTERGKKEDEENPSLQRSAEKIQAIVLCSICTEAVSEPIFPHISTHDPYPVHPECLAEYVVTINRNAEERGYPRSKEDQRTFPCPLCREPCTLPDSIQLPHTSDTIERINTAINEGRIDDLPELLEGARLSELERFSVLHQLLDLWNIATLWGNPSIRQEPFEEILLAVLNGVPIERDFYASIFDRAIVLNFQLLAQRLLTMGIISPETLEENLLVVLYSERFALATFLLDAGARISNHETRAEVVRFLLSQGGHSPEALRMANRIAAMGPLPLPLRAQLFFRSLS